jgi:O-antigen/teichoic acid export membrane protein
VQPLPTSQFLRRHTGFRRILASVSWLTAERVVRMLMGLAVTVWVARYLGPHQFGVLNYAVAFVAVLAPLAALGLDNIVVRDLTRFGRERDEILGTAFALKAAASALAALAALAFVVVVDGSNTITVWLVLILGVGLLCQSASVLDLWFQSQVEARPAALARIAALLVGAALKVALILLQAPLIAFAVAILVETVLVQLGLLWAYVRAEHGLGRWRASKQRAAELVRQSWPLAISGLAVIVYMRIDQIMLENIKGPAAVGVYSAALWISEVWYFVPVFLVRSVTPAFVRTFDGDPARYMERLQVLFALLAGVAIVVALPLTFVATPLVVLLFGRDYAGAGIILSVHVWAGIFVALGAVRTMWIVMHGHTKFQLAATASGAVANIVLNFLLIPEYGGLGAAIATIISYAWSGVLSGVLWPTARPILVQQLRAMLLFDLTKFRRTIA